MAKAGFRELRPSRCLSGNRARRPRVLTVKCLLLRWPPDGRGAPSDATRRLAAKRATACASRRRRSRSSDQVYRVARHLAGSREDADDLVQETYARAFRSWRSYSPGRTCAPGCCASSRTSTSTAAVAQQRTPQMQRARGERLLPLRQARGDRTEDCPTRSASSSGSRRTTSSSALSDGAARLPRRDRAGRHRRLQLPGRGADPRHPDRDRDVAAAPRTPHPQA